MTNAHELFMGFNSFMNVAATYFIANHIMMSLVVLIAYLVRHKSRWVRMVSFTQGLVVIAFELFFGAWSSLSQRNYWINVADLIERGEPVLKTHARWVKSSGITSSSDASFSLFSDPLLLVACLVYLFLLASILFMPDINKER